MMLMTLLCHGAARMSKKAAIVDAGRTLSYRQLHDAAEAAGRYLRTKGLGPGQTVATQIANSVAFAVAVAAADYLGLANLILDPGLKAEESERYCRRAGVASVIRAPVTSHNSPPDGLSVLPITPPEGSRRKDGSYMAHDSRLKESRSSQWGFLLLSSGTGGAPKIVPKTEKQAAAALEAYSSALPYYETDRVLAVLPFFHSFGLYNVLVTSIAAGATLYVEQFTPRETSAAIERNRITVLPATPFMIRMLSATEFKKVPDFSSVRLAVSAGSALPEETQRLTRTKLGLEVVQSYGTTESGPIAIARPDRKAHDAGWVGVGYPGVTIEIRGTSGNRVAPGVDGEIAVKSPGNTSRYLDNSKSSAVAFQGQWVLTGDTGHLNEAGELFVLGRKRRLVNVAGKKVAPAEVEACLRAHGSVADALVLPEKVPEGGERVKAIVVPAGEVSARQLQEFCMERLADFKVPRRILFVESLPRAAARGEEG